MLIYNHIRHRAIRSENKKKLGCELIRLKKTHMKMLYINLQSAPLNLTFLIKDLVYKMYHQWRAEEESQ